MIVIRKQEKLLEIDVFKRIQIETNLYLTRRIFYSGTSLRIHPPRQKSEVGERSIDPN